MCRFCHQNNLQIWSVIVQHKQWTLLFPISTHVKRVTPSALWKKHFRKFLEKKKKKTKKASEGLMGTRRLADQWKFRTCIKHLSSTITSVGTCIPRSLYSCPLYYIYRTFSTGKFTFSNQQSQCGLLTVTATKLHRKIMYFSQCYY